MGTERLRRAKVARRGRRVAGDEDEAPQRGGARGAQGAAGGCRDQGGESRRSRRSRGGPGRRRGAGDAQAGG